LKPHKCDICGIGFGKKCNLVAHERVHRGERPYVCEECGKDFPIPSSLLTHVNQSHKAHKKKWSCSICSQAFVSKSHLEIHKRTHTKEKPWVCDTCGNRFSTKQNMLDHGRLHNDVLPFQCNKCGIRFKWKQSLVRHVMDHTGERPHPCTQCTMSFKTSNGLKKHGLSVHSGIKHHTCEHCQAGFSTSSGKFRHQRQGRCAALKAKQQALQPSQPLPLQQQLLPVKSELDEATTGVVSGHPLVENTHITPHTHVQTVLLTEPVDTTPVNSSLVLDPDPRLDPNPTESDGVVGKTTELISFLVSAGGETNGEHIDSTKVSLTLPTDGSQESVDLILSAAGSKQFYTFTS